MQGPTIPSVGSTSTLPVTTPEPAAPGDSSAIKTTNGQKLLPHPTGSDSGTSGNTSVPLTQRTIAPATVPAQLTSVEKRYIQQAEETGLLKPRLHF